VKALRKIQFSQENAGALAGPISRFQDSVEEVLKDISKAPFLDGVLIPDIALVTGVNVIQHKLGRKLRGWYITRQRASATIWDGQDTNLLPDRTLVLETSADVTVDIWAF
jgi:hypothetical protein